jgi:hypothetical protein
MAPRVRALLDFLVERFGKATGDLDAWLNVDAAAG